jgi:RNA polymerase sigma-70 factor (ECF subfamily)
MFMTETDSNTISPLDCNDEDARDIRMSLEGNGEAYRRLIERHQAQVAAMMWRFSREPGVHEELVHDVFVEAFMSLSNYKAIGQFSNWLARIATRVGYRYWKQRAKDRLSHSITADEAYLIVTEPEPNIEPKDAAELLYKLLQQLPPRDRLVLTLRFVDSHSVEKTAEITGWSQTMVKVQTWRAKQKLKKIMKKAMTEDNL